jgi:hypothetical protein
VSVSLVSEVTDHAWAVLEGRIGHTIVEGLQGLVDGAAEDLRTFGLTIAEDMVRAIQRGDAEWEHEIKAQARLLLEINRLRAVNANYAILMQVLHALVRMGLEIAATFVKGFLTTALKREALQ